MARVEASDTAWRVGAIYRSCVRYGMTAETALHHMRELFTINSGRRGSAENLVGIWFRDMDKRREEYRGP